MINSLKKLLREQELFTCIKDKKMKIVEFIKLDVM